MNDESNNNPNPTPEGEQGQTPPPPPPCYYQQVQGRYIPPPPPHSGSNKTWMIPTAIAIGCLPWLILFLIVPAIIAGLFGSGGRISHSDKHVALIHLTGEITCGRGSNNPFGDNMIGAETVEKQLEEIGKSSGVKAVVLRINSPGGSASGSEEIYNAILRLREKKHIPVYASMGDVAASGGYYIASACDKIYANANTLTGSIGVIFSLGDMSELFKKIGYKPEVVKAGKYKDIGSPNRALTPEEHTMLQNLVNETYDNFLSAVSNGRKIPMNQLKPLAEGKIYTGMSAKRVKLVDEIGGLRDAEIAAAKEGGISGEPKIHEYGKKGLLDSIFSDESESMSGNLSDAAKKEIIKKLLDGAGGIESLK